MNEPVFPEKFVKNHCPRVVNARRRGFKSPEDFAECAFNPAGLGLLCEICNLHLTRPFLNNENEVDREFLPQLEHFYAERKKINMAEDTPSLPTSSEIIKGLSFLEAKASMHSTRGVSVCAEHDVFYAMISDDEVDEETIGEIVRTMESLSWTQNDLNGKLSFQIFV
jgi:hypothetical protein